MHDRVWCGVGEDRRISPSEPIVCAGPTAPKSNWEVRGKHKGHGMDRHARTVQSIGAARHSPKNPQPHQRLYRREHRTLQPAERQSTSCYTSTCSTTPPPSHQDAAAVEPEAYVHQALCSAVQRMSLSRHELWWPPQALTPTDRVTVVCSRLT
jgi:hypothetical protein